MSDRQLATTEDFEARFGDLPEGDVGLVDTRLRDASALVLEEVQGSALEWVSSGGPGSGDAEVPSVVVAVVCAMAHRAWVNPGAVSSESLGGASVSYRGDAAEALYMTPRERRIVKRAAAQTTFEAATYRTPYSDDGDGSSIADPENDLI